MLPSPSLTPNHIANFSAQDDWVNLGALSQGPERHPFDLPFGFFLPPLP